MRAIIVILDAVESRREKLSPLAFKIWIKKLDNRQDLGQIVPLDTEIGCVEAPAPANTKKTARLLPVHPRLTEWI